MNWPKIYRKIALSSANIRLTIWPKGPNKLRILCYHSISAARENELAPRSNLSISNFKEQMVFLRDHGFRSVDFRQLEGYIDGEMELPPKSFLITFDDGYSNVLYDAIPILNIFGFYSIIFVASDYIGSRNTFENDRDEGTNRGNWEKQEFAERYRPLSEEEINNLSRMEGVLIGSHGCSHKPLPLLNDDDQVHEIKESKRHLERIVGREILHFAFPNGKYNRKSFRLTRQTYLYSYSVEKGPVYRGTRGKRPINRHSIQSSCDLEDFQAQIFGGYDWVRALIAGWQRLLPN